MSDRDLKRQYADLEEITYSFLPSQMNFVYAKEMFAAIAGGFASGKTRAMCLKGLILSIVFPGNRGLIGRYHNTDLQDTTMPMFFEVCPASWIKSYRKKEGLVTLFNNSQIVFRHIHDDKTKSATKTRRLGMNLGWFGIDQMEEIQLEHWNAMVSRLRLNIPGLKTPMKRFGFGALNPAGHDWNWKMFFPTARDFGDDGKVDGKFFQMCRPMPNVLGIVVNSEENRVSNAGFVDDSFFDSLLQLYGPDWVARYVRCSFMDFSGKIYKEYNGGIHDDSMMSVHNIDPFDAANLYPNWELVVGIDVGGDSPWAVVPNYIDDWGNTIVAPGFTKRSVQVSEIAAWIKGHLPWNDSRTRYVIDPENKVASLELTQYGIHCQIARKEVLPGILRTAGYFHVMKGRALPPWYHETQKEEQVKKFSSAGSPRTFVMKTFAQYRKEHDTYVWDDRHKNQPKKTDTERWDTCDADRYVKMMLPDVAKLPKIDRYEKLRKIQPAAAKEWEAFDKRVSMRNAKRRGDYMVETYTDVITNDIPRQKFDMDFN